MHDYVRLQTLYLLIGKMLQQYEQFRAPYAPLIIRQAEAERQYSQSYPYYLITDPPPPDVGRSVGAHDMEELAAWMQTTSITAPTCPQETYIATQHAAAGVSSMQTPPNLWPLQDGNSCQPAWLDDPYCSFDPSAFPGDGYVGGHQDATLGEGIDCAVQPEVYTDAALVPPNAAPSISVIEHLEQGTYSRKQAVKGIPAGPIYFNGENGVLLATLEPLVDGEKPAFNPNASIGVKASIRFELPQFPGHTMQVRVRHGDGQGRPAQPITLRELAATVGLELKKLMVHGAKKGEPLKQGGSEVDFDKVVLLRIEHISRGSFQPIIGIRSNG
ncbi:hypothetical protein BD310DRAFT_828303 [Dichomitus squalens]|uniref:Uncharacterized protein n=1 Tax=Dichomitus squalens TaxID=114155 RepID=A0A4Q9PJN4_9APHY|nr:hypothetical protein BD310DRAFT_828303 [Dichomitus squalens]